MKLRSPIPELKNPLLKKKISNFMTVPSVLFTIELSSSYQVKPNLILGFMSLDVFAVIKFFLIGHSFVIFFVANNPTDTAALH